MKRWRTILAVWGVVFAVSARAQERPFRTEIRVVQVPVSVTDAQGRNVDGLKARDFLVLDDGAPQAIELDTFGTGVAPISLVIAIQASGVSTPAMVKIRRIGGMIQPLVIGHRGEAAVLTFDNQIKWRQDFTSESDLLQASVRNLKSTSQSQARLFDAVIDAAIRMKDRKGRKVVLLISESRDRGSEARLEHAIEAVEREGVEVFAAPYSAFANAWIAKPEDLPPPSAPNYLAIFTELFRLAKTNDTQALTRATGGSEYPFLRERAIEKAVESLGVEVHSQYILSFPPAT
ncbi:MAG: VWA domain-containing protein, partial [Acidobacteriota bacterium]